MNILSSVNRRRRGGGDLTWEGWHDPSFVRNRSVSRWWTVSSLRWRSKATRWRRPSLHRECHGTWRERYSRIGRLSVEGPFALRSWKCSSPSSPTDLRFLRFASRPSSASSSSSSPIGDFCEILDKASVEKRSNDDETRSRPRRTERQWRNTQHSEWQYSIRRNKHRTNIDELNTSQSMKRTTTLLRRELTGRGVVYWHWRIIVGIIGSTKREDRAELEGRRGEMSRYIWKLRLHLCWSQQQCR